MVSAGKKKKEYKNDFLVQKEFTSSPATTLFVAMCTERKVKMISFPCPNGLACKLRLHLQIFISVNIELKKLMVLAFLAPSLHE